MANTNDLRIAFNNIGTEISWDNDSEIGIAGSFTITDPAYQSLTKLNDLGMSYIGNEYPKIYSKFYSDTKEYKFEYQSTDFTR